MGKYDIYGTNLVRVGSQILRQFINHVSALLESFSRGQNRRRVRAFLPALSDIYLGNGLPPRRIQTSRFWVDARNSASSNRTFLYKKTNQDWACIRQVFKGGGGKKKGVRT